MYLNNLHQRQADRWIRFALWTWVAFSVALCAKVLVEGDRHSVYPAFAGAGRDWMAGEVMYDHQGYYYSPTFSVFFIPFSMLPNRLGQVLWGLLSVGLYLLSLRGFYRHALPRHWPRAMEAGFLLLALIGSLRSIWSLQSNTLLIACILFAASAIVRGRWWRAAWLLAAPIYIKVWPAIAGGLLSLHWPRKLIGRGIAVCAALACAPFFTKPSMVVIGYYRDWFQCLLAREVGPGRFTGYRDAWTIWEQFSSQVNPKAYFVLQAIGGLVTLAWCLSLRMNGREGRRTAPELVTLTLAAWSVWQLLLGPGTERLTYIVIAPFAAWAMIASYLEKRLFRLAIVAFVTTFILGAGGIERMLIQWMPAAVALQPTGVILFAVWLVCHAQRDHSWEGQTIVASPERRPMIEITTHVERAA
ncbi:MAG: DUF2029 domain-containing protein [Pirellulales bacterium]|nr:DUF2029 domain-containing protein [Pirellulales bacterium]